MMSRSFKPSSSTMRPRTRPPLGHRTSSASSIASQRSQGESLPRSPSAVGPSMSAGYFTIAAASSASTSGAKYLPSSPSLETTTTTTGTATSNTRGFIIPDSPRLNRSRPIKISLPPPRRSAPVETPPEPLSARGDLLGGYFPLHEDFQRSYKPHPFYPQRDNNNNNNPHSSSPGSETSTSTMPESESPLYSPRSPHLHPLTQMTVPTSRQENLRPPPSLAMPPSLSPSAMTLPMGKYHPSNYKNKNSDNLTPATLLGPASAATSSQSSNPTQSHIGQQHRRQTSEVQKKLQQYQRDMVEQAAIAARMQLPGVRPTSPRLAPLGSPGPVTPMELEERSEYFFAGSTTTTLTQEEIIDELIRSEPKRVDSSTSSVTVTASSSHSK